MLILAPTDPSLWLILVTGGLVVLVALFASESWTRWRETRHTPKETVR